MAIKLNLEHNVDIHYIEGNAHNLFLSNPTIPLDKNIPIPLVINKKEPIPKEDIDNLIKTLNNLGIEVEYLYKEWPDPNFESYEEAMDYLMNKGE